MPKIVILGSLKHGPYEVIAPKMLDPEKYEKDHEAAYEDAKKILYPAIEAADIIIVWTPEDIIIDHTKVDVTYALVNDKRVVIIGSDQAFDTKELK